MENLVYLTVSETDNFTVHILSPWTSDELFQLLIKKKCSITWPLLTPS